MSSQAITFAAFSLLFSGLSFASDATPNSFLDSLQLMDSSSEVQEDTGAPARELTPNDILMVSGDGYSPSANDAPEDASGLDESDIAPIESLSSGEAGAPIPDGGEKASPEPASIRDEDKKESKDSENPVRLPDYQVTSTDISNANAHAKPIKDKYLVGKRAKSKEQSFQGIRRKLTVTPGVLEVLPVSNAGHINRILTPFDSPLVKTTSGAAINTVGPVVEISTTSSGTIVIYISDQEQTPETTFSIALVPKAVPPLDVSLSFDPLLKKQYSQQGYMSAKAKKWEEQQDYVDALVSIMKPLANQQIPPGYTFCEVMPGEPHSDLFRCQVNGFKIQLLQRLDGHHFKVGVHRVTNMLSVPVEFREPSCYRKGIAGISAYPQVVLRPGETTELYIAQRSNVSASTIDMPERPSVANRKVSHGTY